MVSREWKKKNIIFFENLKQTWNYSFSVSHPQKPIFKPLKTYHWQKKWFTFPHIYFFSFYRPLNPHIYLIGFCFSPLPTSQTVTLSTPYITNINIPHHLIFITKKLSFVLLSLHFLALKFKGNQKNGIPHRLPWTFRSQFLTLHSLSPRLSKIHSHLLPLSPPNLRPPRHRFLHRHRNRIKLPPSYPLRNPHPRFPPCRQFPWPRRRFENSRMCGVSGQIYRRWWDQVYDEL